MARLERDGSRPARFELAGERAVVGTSPSSDVVVGDDATVSRAHLVLEHLGGVWVATDLGSRNGTWLNGAPLDGPRAVHDHDELVIGRTRLVFRDGTATGTDTPTSPIERAPLLTRREREVLAALCRPLLEGSVLAAPLKVRELAAALYISESAAKKALGRLYDRFVLTGGDRTTARLAGAALRTGAVNRADLRGARS